jgi:tryptophan synthase alpha chain
VVLMGYLNPMERLGLAAFAEHQAAARPGVDGVLTVDMPPRRPRSSAALLKAHGSPRSSWSPLPLPRSASAATICAHGEGYLYYVSLKGVTGSATLDTDATWPTTWRRCGA